LAPCRTSKASRRARREGSGRSGRHERPASAAVTVQIDDAYQAEVDPADLVRAVTVTLGTIVPGESGPAPAVDRLLRPPPAAAMAATPQSGDEVAAASHRFGERSGVEASALSSRRVALVVTDDEAVRALNRQYRGLDEPTDVLSFPAQDPAPGFVAAPGSGAYLGDVIVALPFARQQATGLGRSLKDELRLLAVHGTLHLLGYDHAEPDEEARMWALQERILALLAA